MKNITLSADESLIDSARAYAQAHGTTLNDLIRGYLAVLASPRDPKEVAEEFAREALEQSGCSEEGWRFNRDEIHKRGNWM
jgi:ribosomal protein L10